MGKKTVIILALVLLLTAGALIVVTLRKNAKAKKLYEEEQRRLAASGNPSVNPPVKQPVGTTGGVRPQPGLTGTPAGTQWMPEDVFPLQQGSTGKRVKMLQWALGVTADGKFGPKTAAALKKWDNNLNLTQEEYNILVVTGKIPLNGMQPQFMLPLKVGSNNKYWTGIVQIHAGIAPTGNFGSNTETAIKKLGYTDGVITMPEAIALAKVSVPAAPGDYSAGINFPTF